MCVCVCVYLSQSRFANGNTGLPHPHLSSRQNHSVVPVPIPTPVYRKAELHTRSDQLNLAQIAKQTGRKAKKVKKNKTNQHLQLPVARAPAEKRLSNARSRASKIDKLSPRISHVGLGNYVFAKSDILENTIFPTTMRWLTVHMSPTITFDRLVSLVQALREQRTKWDDSTALLSLSYSHI